MEKAMVRMLSLIHIFNYSRLISLFRNTNQAFPFDGNRVEAYTLGLSMLPVSYTHLEYEREEQRQSYDEITQRTAINGK